jgi:hypothetical protein
MLDLNEEINFDNLIIGKQIKMNDNLTKIYLYWLDDKPKEIYFKLPSVRLVYNFKNLKYNQVKIPLYPIWDKTQMVINFLKKLEKIIQQKIKINKQYSPILEKKDKLTTIKINLPTNIKITSKINDIKLTDFTINSEIEGIISIPWIWIRDDSWGLSLYGYQLKYIPRIEEYDVNFYDDIKIIKEKDKIKEELQINVKSINIPPQINKPIFKISPSLLSDAMSKMKKI